MPSWLSRISFFVTWGVRIASAIVAAIGKHSEVQAAVSNASGAFSSGSEYAAEVATSWNWQASGIGGLLVSFVIPKVFEYLGKRFASNPIKPGWNSAADAAALGTLKHITRVGRTEDITHIDALIASGVMLETQARIDGSV